MIEAMADDSSTYSNIDAQITYHKQMKDVATKAGDFTKAEHHRIMCEMLAAMKERAQQTPNKTPEQLIDEDYKVAPTSADK